MRIDSLKTTPDRAGRYWVSFDDGTRLGLYRQTVEDFGLYPGKEFSQREMEALCAYLGKEDAESFLRILRRINARTEGENEC